MKKILIWIFIAAVIVRIFALITDDIYPLQSDAGTYYADGENIANGGFIDYLNHPPQKYGPVYPIFIGFVFKLTGIGQRQIYTFQILLDLITIIIIYFIGKQIAEEKVGVLAAGLYSFHPAPIVFTRCVLTETLSLFFISLFFLLLYLAIEKRKNWIFFLAGLTGLIGGLVRYDLLLFPVICAFWILFYFSNDLKTGLNFFLSFFLLYIIILFAVMLQFGSYSKKVAFSLYKKNVGAGFKTLYENMLDMWDGVMVRQAVGSRGEDYNWRYSPIPFIISFPVYLIVMWCSFFSILINKINKKNLLLYIFLIFWTAEHVLTLSLPRYQVPAIPAIVILFSIFFFRLIEIRKKCG